MLAVTCGRALACALVLCCAVSCVEKEGGGKKIDPAYVQQNLLTEAPAELDNRVDADLGGKVVYLGNEVDSEVLRPGGAARVVHYWQVIEAPGSEWRVFTHLNGGGKWMNLDATDMRAGHPPAKWQAGQVIRDEQRFTLDAGWTASDATLSVGLYRKGGGGAGDRMPIVSGPKDDESRVPAARFQVEGASAAGTSTEYVVRRASGPITIDGRADEAAWKQAAKSPAFSPAEGGTAMPDHTVARLLWDDEHLYAFIEATDDDVHSQYTEHDDSLWKEDVVELFIDADGNGRGYVELQVNPNNAQLDAWFPRTRAQKSHFEWKADMSSAVVVHGTAGDRSDTDRGYDVEIAIPLAAVKGLDESMDVAIPPALGDRWRLNVVRVEKPADAPLMASSWNTIPIQDFHALDRMLTVVFGDEDGATAAAAADEAVAGDADEGAAPEEPAAAPATEEAARALPTGTGRRSKARELRMKAAKERARAAEEADPRGRRPANP